MLPLGLGPPCRWDRSRNCRKASASGCGRTAAEVQAGRRLPRRVEPGCCTTRPAGEPTSCPRPLQPAGRAAADERARRAELERVRVQGEKATSAERRKRRRLAIGAAVLGEAAVGGLVVVLAVQRRANAELAAMNHELGEEQAKVQARFELAQKAIALFHTGVSEDALLRNAEFKELRTKLLKEAAGFYARSSGASWAPMCSALATSRGSMCAASRSRLVERYLCCSCTGS